MLISGPKQLSNDIDVFLEPFMEDMKILWEEWVKMMDASLKKEFTPTSRTHHSRRKQLLCVGRAINAATKD
jgi:hypothetical protein